MVINSSFLLVVPVRIYQDHKQSYQSGYCNSAVEHNVRRRKEFIASNEIMPIPVPRKAKFGLQGQDEQKPGANAT